MLISDTIYGMNVLYCPIGHGVPACVDRQTRIALVSHPPHMQPSAASDHAGQQGTWLGLAETVGAHLGAMPIVKGPHNANNLTVTVI
jgi:hypothetical protein